MSGVEIATGRDGSSSRWPAIAPRILLVSGLSREELGISRPNLEYGPPAYRQAILGILYEGGVVTSAVSVLNNPREEFGNLGRYLRVNTAERRECSQVRNASRTTAAAGGGHGSLCFVTVL